MHFFHELKFSEIGSLFFWDTFLIRDNFTEKLMIERVVVIWCHHHLEITSQFVFGFKRIAFGNFALIRWCCNAANRPIMHDAISGWKIRVLCPLKWAWLHLHMLVIECSLISSHIHREKLVSCGGKLIGASMVQSILHLDVSFRRYHLIRNRQNNHIFG